MAIAGLILGILSIIGSWIPFVVFAAWLMAIAGIVLSAMAMKQSKSGVAIAGLVLSIIGLVIALPMFFCSVICASAAASAAGTLGSFGF